MCKYLKLKHNDYLVLYDIHRTQELYLPHGYVCAREALDLLYREASWEQASTFATDCASLEESPVLLNLEERQLQESEELFPGT